MSTITVEEHLRKFRETHGEEAWRAEVQRLALDALRTKSEKQETFWRALTNDFDWLDWDQLKVQAQTLTGAPSTELLIAEAIKSQMPGIKSQAQYNAVVAAMESVRHVVNAVLEGDHRREQDAREALWLSFDAIRKATELTRKLEEVPEAASSAAAQEFKDPPAQFHEIDVQAHLLQELALVTTLETLKDWYDSTRDKRNKIVTQSLRNELLDAIRAKRKMF